MGSPTNHPARDRVQSGLHTLKHLDKANLAILPRNFKKKKNGPYTGPVLLGQGEPCTSQYIGLFNVFKFLVLLNYMEDFSTVKIQIVIIVIIAHQPVW